jgi:threonine/homoserine/homoserine lactone efflux protein
MPYLNFAITGLAAGIAIAAPVGPTTVLVINRTAKHSLASGLKSGLGAAMADASFGLLAALGISFVASFVYQHEFAIKLIGGGVLLFWGGRIFISKFTETHPLVKGEGKGGPFVSTYLLTLTNPMTLLAFMGILASLGILNIKNNFTVTGIWVAGLATGSFLWWLALSKFTNLMRNRLDGKIFSRINRLTGAIVVAAGILVLLNILK